MVLCGAECCGADPGIGGCAGEEFGEQIFLQGAVESVQVQCGFEEDRGV